MPDRSTQATVLVVDDDPALGQLIRRSLEREGFQAAIAPSGREALNWLAEHRADLMMLDLKLQDVQGSELICDLASRGLSVPFVVITGQGDERVAVEMMKRGALDYLVKDLRFQEFFPAVVRRALQQVERDRKLAAAELALKKEHSFIRAVLDTCGALVVVLDKEGGIVRFNRACEVLTGYTFHEVRGKTVWDLFLLPADASRIRDTFSALASGAFPLPQENHWVARGGKRHLITWSNTVLFDQKGDVEFVIGTGIDITERKQLEREIIEISDLEQRRIGQDLHDGLCQQLAGIEFMSQALEQKLAPKSRQEAAAAAQIARLIRETISHTRDLAKGLSPVILDPEGLMSALKLLADNIRTLFHVDCSFLCPEPVLIHDNSVATHLFRIAQEAANNAIRHGQAGQLFFSLARESDRIVLKIRDNGIGLPDHLPDGKGMGLRIMNYRAGVIGGSLLVQRGEPSGTLVACSLDKGRFQSPKSRTHEKRKKR
jgi:PAS domain S-box-containing protein